MFKKRLVRHGNSDALVINSSLIKMLDIIPRETFVDLRLEGDCLIVRRVGGGRRKSSKTRAAHGLLQKLEALAAAGLTRELFKRMSRDGKSLQEVSSNVMHGVAVDPVTIVRIEDCFERRKNCRESWDATVTAVLARRTKLAGAVDDNSEADDDVT